jgi:PIN domain nuclease of toxin-antitoxin system
VRVLLDTQALVWYAFADPHLSTTARAVIANPANEVLVSPASYWEIAIKVSLGKWQLHQPYPDLIDSLWTVYGFRILPITSEHTGRLIGLPFHHRDPFDRLLAAQAFVESVPLVSSDPVFDRYGVTRVWN